MLSRLVCRSTVTLPFMSTVTSLLPSPAGSNFPPLPIPIPSTFTVAPFPHLFIVQRLSQQSLFWLQPRLVWHDGQLPPQSTSVSLPFLTPSLHDGGWQALFTHSPFMQSVPMRQPCMSAHLLQSGPPQSTSVSMPFLIMSLQV